MSTIPDISEPASELERLIADLSESGPLVFGDGFSAAHLMGATTQVFRGPADRRWWHVVLGDDRASWTMDVRVDEISRGPVRARALPVRPLVSPGRRSWAWISWGPAGTRSSIAACTACMRASGCARRSWRPGGHCANATATATSRESIRAPSGPRLPEPSSHRPIWARNSNASSNTDVLDRTDADRLDHVGADQPKHRTISDGFDTDRACLLIRGLSGQGPYAGYTRDDLA